MSEAITKKPSCYGAMFPDLSRLQYNTPCAGAVFFARLDSCGIGVQSSTVDADRKAWERCLDCDHFRSCYDLGMAKLALAHAVEVRA